MQVPAFSRTSEQANRERRPGGRDSHQETVFKNLHSRGHLGGRAGALGCCGIRCVGEHDTEGKTGKYRMIPAHTFKDLRSPKCTMNAIKTKQILWSSRTSECKCGQGCSCDVAAQPQHTPRNECKPNTGDKVTVCDPNNPEFTEE